MLAAPASLPRPSPRAAVCVPKNARPEPAPPVQLPNEFFLGDPFDFGRASAVRQSSPPTQAGESSDSAPATVVSNHGDADGDAASHPGSDSDSCLGDLDPGPLDAPDLVEELEHALGLDADIDCAADPPALTEGDADSDGEAASDPEAEVALLDDAAPPGPPGPADYVATCTMTPLGYISTTLPPLSALAVVGRITDWPADKPEPDRSCSCRCYMHPGCTTPAKRRRFLTNDLLLRWLFAGDFLPDGTREEKKAAGERHKRMFKDMFDATVR